MGTVSKNPRTKNNATANGYWEAYFKEMEKEYPEPVFRMSVGELTKGGINPRTLANLDSQGLGPQGMFYVGRKAAYSRSNFLAWFKSRITAV